jgi:hypothetical protein
MSDKTLPASDKNADQAFRCQPEIRPVSSSVSCRQIQTRFNVVAVRVDEKGAIVRLSTNAMFAVAAYTKRETGPMKPIDLT